METKVKANQVRDEKGITLIALLVMIIVLIMISAVVIRGLTDDKLIDTSMTTVDEYNIASYKEQVEQSVRGIVLKNAAGGRDTSINELAEEMQGTETIWVKSAEVSTGENNSDMLVTVVDGYVYQVYYDSTYGVVFTEYVGKDDEKGFPSLKTSYSRSKAKITGSVTAENGASISKVELIYKGEVQATADNTSDISFDVEKIGTGWYIVKATSTSGKVRYNWIRVSTVSDKLRKPTIIVTPQKPESNWYNKESGTVKVTITAQSGAATGIKYWTNRDLTSSTEGEGNTGERVTDVIISEEGATTITAVEIDGEGNESEDKAVETVKIDITSPMQTVTQQIIGKNVAVEDKDKPNGWYREDVEVIVDVQDADSGPDGYEYTKKDGESIDPSEVSGWTKQAQGTKIEFKEDGINTVAIHGLDVAGNKSETTDTVTIRLDKKAPLLETKDIVINSVTTNSCNVQATATDEWSGNNAKGGKLTYTCKVKSGEIEASGATITPVTDNTTGKFNITGLNPKQAYNIEITATDLAGNIGSTSTTMSTSGVLQQPSITITGPDGTNGWKTGNVHILISDTADSGITGATGIHYEIIKKGDNSNVYHNDVTTTSTGYDFNTHEGEFIVSAYMKGENGQTSSPNTATFKRDTQAPTNVTLSPTGNYSTTIPVEATANDATSGIASYDFQCKEGNGAWRSCGVCNVSTIAQSYNYTLEEGKTYSLRCLVTDNAGNKTYSDGSNPETGEGGNVLPPAIQTSCTQHSVTTWSDWSAGSCIERKTRTGTCTICKQLVTQEGEFGEHQGSLINNTAATCTEPPKHNYTCNLCQTSYSVSYGEALGHNFKCSGTLKRYSGYRSEKLVVGQRIDCTFCSEYAEWYKVWDWRCGKCGRTEEKGIYLCSNNHSGYGFTCGADTSTCSRCGATK